MGLYRLMGLFLFAAGSTPPASPPATIPESFQGRWVFKVAGCSNPEYVGAVEIGDKRLDSWEATEEIISIKAERSVITLKAKSYDSNADDPETPRFVSIRLALVDGGKRLQLQEIGKPPMTFIRCARAPASR